MSDIVEVKHTTFTQVIEYHRVDDETYRDILRAIARCRPMLHEQYVAIAWGAWMILLGLAVILTTPEPLAGLIWFGIIIWAARDYVKACRQAIAWKGHLQWYRKAAKVRAMDWLGEQQRRLARRVEPAHGS